MMQVSLCLLFFDIAFESALVMLCTISFDVQKLNAFPTVCVNMYARILNIL
jgi:hypothetical protein